MFTMRLVQTTECTKCGANYESEAALPDGAIPRHADRTPCAAALAALGRCPACLMATLSEKTVRCRRCGMRGRIGELPAR
jgi:hypothetical protein